MKKLFALVLALTLALTAAATAETAINGTESRGIVLCDVEDNEEIEGVSPTTGRTLADIEVPDGFAGLAATGRYMPMLVQIDNADGGVGYRAPWNLAYADIIYETPLYLTSKEHHSVETRLSALFSDLIPDEVGPLRSARMGHAMIREEWDCGFMYYGQQEYEGTNVVEYFASTGADKKGVLFSGTSGHSYKEYIYARAGLAAPHDKGCNLAMLASLIPESHTARSHVSLFTTEVPEGDAATEIFVNWNFEDYNSRLVYDAETGLYSRYMLDGSNNATLYTDYTTGDAITFANVIIQWTQVDWPRVDAPYANMIGEGNADFFMAGVHVSGYWKRESTESRTVFYDADGNEMEFQVGTSLIVTMPLEHTVSYQ